MSKDNKILGLDSKLLKEHGYKVLGASVGLAGGIATSKFLDTMLVVPAATAVSGLTGIQLNVTKQTAYWLKGAILFVGSAALSAYGFRKKNDFIAYAGIGGAISAIYPVAQALNVQQYLTLSGLDETLPTVKGLGEAQEAQDAVPVQLSQQVAALPEANLNLPTINGEVGDFGAQNNELLGENVLSSDDDVLM